MQRRRMQSAVPCRPPATRRGPRRPVSRSRRAWRTAMRWLCTAQAAGRPSAVALRGPDLKVGRNDSANNCEMLLICGRWVRGRTTRDYGSRAIAQARSLLELISILSQHEDPIFEARGNMQGCWRFSKRWAPLTHRRSGACTMRSRRVGPVAMPPGFPLRLSSPSTVNTRSSLLLSLALPPVSPPRFCTCGAPNDDAD